MCNSYKKNIGLVSSSLYLNSTDAHIAYYNHLTVGKHRNVKCIRCLLPIATLWFFLKYVQKSVISHALSRSRCCFICRFLNQVTRFGAKVGQIGAITWLFRSELSTFWHGEPSVLEFIRNLSTHTRHSQVFYLLV